MLGTEVGRLGGWLQTHSGRRCWPLDLRVDEVAIGDIAHSLSLVCRFGGHCSAHYSVAQHSCMVAELVEAWRPDVALHALLHDAAEAYLGDVVRGLKPFLYAARSNGQPIERFQQAEDRVARTVAQAFGLRELRSIESATVTYADNVALATEARDLLGATFEGLPLPELAHIVPLEPAAAERGFLAHFTRLTASMEPRA